MLQSLGAQKHEPPWPSGLGKLRGIPCVDCKCLPALVRQLESVRGETHSLTSARHGEKCPDCMSKQLQLCSGIVSCLCVPASSGKGVPAPAHLQRLALARKQGCVATPCSPALVREHDSAVTSLACWPRSGNRGVLKPLTPLDLARRWDSATSACASLC